MPSFAATVAATESAAGAAVAIATTESAARVSGVTAAIVMTESACVPGFAAPALVIVALAVLAARTDVMPAEAERSALVLVDAAISVIVAATARTFAAVRCTATGSALAISFVGDFVYVLVAITHTAIAVYRAALTIAP